MYKILLIFFLLNLYNTAFSSPKEKIISRMELINNMSFNFVQTIGDKREIGKCTIKYPKKFTNQQIIRNEGYQKSLLDDKK